MTLYELALRAYPAEYREERGDEILATLAEVHGERRASLGELGALVRAGLRERNRADRAPWRHGLGVLAIPLACVNAAVALAGLYLAWPSGPGRWWPTFAAIACALAVATAARFSAPAMVLGLANLALIGNDALTMAPGRSSAPHLRLLEHTPVVGQIPFPPLAGSVPSNPTEFLPFAIVLALASLCVRPATLSARMRSARAALALGSAALLAVTGLVFPDSRFAWLLVPALAVALGGLLAGVFYRRYLVVGIGLLVAIAPSVFWFLSRGNPVQSWNDFGTIDPTGSATRNIVPGLIGVAVLGLVAAVATLAARRSAEPS